MPDAISVQVTRGDVVEASHRVHAVAVDGDGRVLESAGNPELVTFLRSAAKPFQALPLVRAFPGLAHELVAVACSSHLARPEQLAAVRELLALAGAAESALETGPDPTTIEHTCSGKHAGFLAVCHARGWQPTGYSALAHPLQQELLTELAEVVGLARDAIPIGIDGCGVPTFALPLRTCARLFGRILECDGGTTVAAALQARPELLRGPIAADAKLIAELPGWIAKGGAEGLYCAASSDGGLAIALKVEDGAFRAILPALGIFLRRLGVDPGSLGYTRVVNSLGAQVGTVA